MNEIPKLETIDAEELISTPIMVAVNVTCLAGGKEKISYAVKRKNYSNLLQTFIRG